MKNEIFIQITRIQTRVQTNSDGKGGWKVPSGKGQRLKWCTQVEGKGDGDYWQK